MSNFPMSTDQTNTLAIDVKGLASIKNAAKQNSPEALKAAAQQFEGLFVNMMMKSMRATIPSSGLNDSSAQKMYTSMLDQQLSQTISQRGIGLADMMVRQLKARENTIAPPDASQISQLPQAQLSAIPVEQSPIKQMELYQKQLAIQAAQTEQKSSFGSKVFGGVKDFVQAVADGAQEASQMTGIPSAFITAQAALESGWGKRQILNSDGSTSHNLFGIKAGPGWNGKVAKVWTLEYINGSYQKVLANFRSYDSYQDSFKDYANLLTKSPRYQSVIANGQTAAGFANGLQNAGYATDPGYANKLKSIIQNIGVS
jgi:peptidoglycan hydrolase FlgJ